MSDDHDLDWQALGQIGRLGVRWRLVRFVLMIFALGAGCGLLLGTAISAQCIAP